jgi:hypothetical protein
MGRMTAALLRRIEPRADEFFRRHGDAITDTVHAWTTAAPKFNPAERDLDRAHRAFLATAKLNTTYWSPNGKWIWLWPDSDDEPTLVPVGRYVFVRREKYGTGLVTEHNITSRQALREAWPERLLTCEPSEVPPKPRMPEEIRDSLHRFR